MDQKLFRKSVIEKMASPDRLDEMMQVTAPTGWVALAALGFVILAAVVWGILGSLSMKVEGQGILMRGGAVLAVSSGASGRVRELLVRPGDVVEAGDIVATVAQPDLALRIENTEEELDSLLAQTGTQQVNSGRILEQLRRQKTELERKIAAEEELVRQGITARNAVIGTKAELASVEQQIAQQEISVAGRSNRVDSLRRELEELRSRMESSSEVKSSYRGRVLELSADAGDLVREGERLLTMEALEGPIDAVLYIPAADGKRVQPGMTVRVSPSTVRTEEYGFILARVKSVSDYPVTPEGMVRVLRNQNLAATLASGGSQIELVAQLDEDGSTPSGFKWTSSEGPPNQVATGTICMASVIVDRKRPISYVIPIFKKSLGIS